MDQIRQLIDLFLEFIFYDLHFHLVILENCDFEKTDLKDYVSI